MQTITQLVECVPNFSEGRDKEKIEKIVEPFRHTPGVKLLDYQNDEDHNRMVVTIIGSPEDVKTSMIEAIGVAIDLIDMTRHKGQHPRMGAVDVVPFIPVAQMSMQQAVELSKEVAGCVSAKYNLPIFLYEASATDPSRTNLARIRKGQFEKMPEKLKQPQWKPDFGKPEIHPTAGVTAMGARMPLVAYNVNLDTADLTIADEIAKKIRHINGGLRFCKAMGVALTDRNIVQVSMNLTDYTQTALYRVFELIRIEAKRYGVNVVGSQVVGMIPMAALIDSSIYYLGIENFTMTQVLEQRLLE